MKPVKILGIAPYKGMGNLMQIAASKREDIELTAHIGDLSTGVQIAQQFADYDFDCILSRGGTAELIKKETSLPVIEITLSVYDILRSIKLAENHNCSCAIVGFPSIIENAKFLCEVLRYDIDIYTIHNQEEARNTLLKLESSGCKMILCDVITNAIAQEYGMPALLITSGIESINAAFDLAVQKTLALRASQEQAEFYRSILKSLPEDIFVYDKNGNLCYASHNNELPSCIQNKLVANPHFFYNESNKKVAESENGFLYTLNKKTLENEDAPYSLLILSSHRLTTPLEKSGIAFVDRTEAVDPFFVNFYSIIYSSSDVSIEKHAQSSQPTMIYGEKGIGKDNMARLLFTKSTKHINPLIEIDCAKLSGKGWKYLMENDLSPFNGSDNTLYFKQMSVLSDNLLKELIYTLKALRVSKYNKLIFSSTCSTSGELTPQARSIMDEFSCTGLYMVPIRNYTQDFSGLLGLNLSTLNMDTARSVLGFDSGAIEALTTYHWPGNYDQFKRVLNELVQDSDTPYISLTSVNNILAREQAFYGHTTQGIASMGLNRSLEEINLDILHQVLAEENNNQSKAAQRLCISRTTLWRMLQK